MKNTSIKILAVDDDPDVLFATVRALRNAGYEVIEAASGEECLMLAKKHRPDLILLDVMMPDINGFEVCRRIKSDPELQNMYVMILSSTKTESDSQAEGLEIGADGYIARPFPNRELLARVAAMVRLIRAERERDKVIAELQAALAKVKQLSGMLPICATCKKIRDDQGYWQQIEAYIRDHSEAEFTHGICPECLKKFYEQNFPQE